MQKILSEVLDESILLELHVAKLYRLFHDIFPEHATFWWKIHLEEENHAALVRSIKEHFVPIGKVPIELLSASLQKLQESNAAIVSLITQYTHTPPSLEEAFNTALELELTAGEIHYQDFMDKDQQSTLNKTFQKLNKDDKNHAARLRSHMKRHGIAIKEPT